MSTRSTIVYGSTDDDMENIHIYDECFDTERHVYLEYMYNHERGQAVVNFVMSRKLWESLVADILKRGKP